MEVQIEVSLFEIISKRLSYDCFSQSYSSSKVADFCAEILCRNPNFAVECICRHIMLYQA